MTRVVFLSHAGIDTEAARALKARILAAPAAQENGLSVWFDKDDLAAGQPWQRQIETAIEHSYAFAVYVGSKGVANWVDAEVRLALNRAITEPDYRFIPVLAGGAPGPDALPGFARQFQGVVDVESRSDQFDALMRAILDGAEAGQLQLEAEPFFGLRAIDESRSHLFFGREAEAEALIALVHRTPLVMVTGDSGCGKSSLVRAGLIPRFLGGALALLNGSRPEDAIWHTVATRPRNQPFRQLGEAVDGAAKSLGLTLADRGTLADWAASGEPGKVRRALRCDLPSDRARVLLVVDQLEELLTITPPEVRGPFIDLLLDLADPADGRYRVVLTMRHDYVNLCSAFDRLKERLDADQRRARFPLGRVSDEGLHRIVTAPLRLAGIDAADREALAVQVLRDVGERPGDLALVQMALTETWHARHRHGGDLLRAYAEVGGVEGALAQAAERVRIQGLDEHQQSLLDSILLRLVRLGDTGGATRRVAARTEFDEARWRLVQTLASEDGKRLVLLGGSLEQPTVEIAHEALVTAWPYFQNLLQAVADDKRILDALIPRARAWAASTSQEESNKRLATGADLELFAGLLGRRAEWLSDEERQFVEVSKAMEARRRRRNRMFTRALGAAAAILLILSAVAGWMSWRATEAEEVARDAERAALEARNFAVEESEKATAAAKAARANESRALAAISALASEEHFYVDAVKLAIAAWPRAGEEDRPKLRFAIRALGVASRSQRQIPPLLRHEGEVQGAAFSHDERHILSWSEDGTTRLWDAASGEKLLTLRHEGAVNGAVFSADGGRILSWSFGGTACLWDAATGRELLTFPYGDNDTLGALFSRDERHILSWFGWPKPTVRLWNAVTGEELLTLRHEHLSGAVFSADGGRILSWSFGGTACLWDAATGRELLTFPYGDNDTLGALFSGDGRRILFWSGDGTARLSDAATGRELLTFPYGDNDTLGAAFSHDERRILSWSADGTIHLWDVTSGEEVLILRHEGAVSGAVFSADERRILSWSRDGTARVWDISRLPKGNLIDVACGLLPDHDTSDLKDRYGIAITTPICTPGTPPPVAAELQD